MNLPERVELIAGGSTVIIDGGEGCSPDDDCLVLGADGIEGWLDMPDEKTTVSERGQGDGAHDVADVLYAIRVLTIHFTVNAHDRQGIVSLLGRVRRMCAHREVTVRVLDGGLDCTIKGRAVLASSSQYGKDGWLEDNTLTVSCERPEFLAYSPHNVQIRPCGGGLPSGGLAGGGLSYGTSGKGLAYPLDYGLKPTSGSVDMTGSNVAVLENHGTSRAYPVFTVHGSFPDGVSLVFNGSDSTLSCTQPVENIPLVLDCRSRTATMGGLDVSRTLTSRGFPVVPADGTVNIALQATGTGWVDCDVYDTFM